MNKNHKLAWGFYAPTWRTSVHTASGTASTEQHIITTTLQSEEGHKVFLGLFENEITPPDFDIHFSPDIQEGVKSELVRIKGDGEYRLFYYFQNFTDTSYKIKIIEKECIV